MSKFWKQPTVHWKVPGATSVVKSLNQVKALSKDESEEILTPGRKAMSRALLGFLLAKDCYADFKAFCIRWVEQIHHMLNKTEWVVKLGQQATGQDSRASLASSLESHPWSRLSQLIRRASDRARPWSRPIGNQARKRQFSQRFSDLVTGQGCLGLRPTHLHVDPWVAHHPACCHCPPYLCLLSFLR